MITESKVTEVRETRIVRQFQGWELSQLMLKAIEAETGQKLIGEGSHIKADISYTQAGTGGLSYATVHVTITRELEP